VSSRRAVLSWVALYSAMLLDVVQVFALDLSDGFTDPALGAVAIAAFATEVSLFSIALRRIESAVAYGFYGLGTAVVAAISIGWLGEPLTPLKGIALVAVIAGAVLLNMDGAKPPVSDSATGDGEQEPVVVNAAGCSPRADRPGG
jgi:multidrug transporter EmrE-like cation transporter